MDANQREWHERVVVGGLILHCEKFWTNLPVELEPRHFHHDLRKRIFRTVGQLKSMGAEVDMASIYDHGKFFGGDTARLAALTDDLTDVIPFWSLTPSRVSASAYRLVQVELEQKLAQEFEKEARRLGRGDGDLQKLISVAMSHISSGPKKRTGPIPLTKIPPTVQRPGWPMPWDDMEIKGVVLQPGHLAILGARTSRGKSHLGMQIGRSGAAKGYLTAYLTGIDLEPEELRDRQQDIVENDELLLLDAVKPEEVYSRITWFAKFMRVKWIVLDYIQCLFPPIPKWSKFDSVGRFALELKALARELDIGILALAQLARRAEGRGKKIIMPSMADLKYSGEMEEIADHVWLVHYPDGNELNNIELLIAKNRHGPSRQVVKLLADWEHGRALPRADQTDEDIPF